MIVYVSIGNSDDKLTQREWAMFVGAVHDLFHRNVDRHDVTVHGRWLSEPSTPWQNACWCVEFTDPEPFKSALGRLAVQFGQDCIAWAEVKDTEFLGADGG